MFLGGEDFIARMQAPASIEQRRAVEVPKVQRKSAGPLRECLRRTADRPEALRVAYRQRHYDDREGEKVGALGVAQQSIDCFGLR